MNIQSGSFTLTGKLVSCTNLSVSLKDIGNTEIEHVEIKDNIYHQTVRIKSKEALAELIKQLNHLKEEMLDENKENPYTYCADE